MSRHAWILTLAQCCFFAYVYAAAPLSTQNIADRVGFAQHLSAVVPSDLRFRDETGRAVSIGDYRGTTPIVLVFSYFGCSTLCPTFIAHLVQMLEQTDLTPGRQYMVSSSASIHMIHRRLRIRRRLFISSRQRSAITQARGIC